MKLEEIFDVTSILPDTILPSNEELFHSTVIPVNVDIKDTDMVDLVKDSQIIYSAAWVDMKEYLRMSFSELNGTYQVASNGMVVHSFTVSQS